jgi:hypothetical protein
VDGVSGLNVLTAISTIKPKPTTWSCEPSFLPPDGRPVLGPRKKLSVGLIGQNGTRRLHEANRRASSFLKFLCARRPAIRARKIVPGDGVTGSRERGVAPKVGVTREAHQPEHRNQATSPGPAAAALRQCRRRCAQGADGRLAVITQQFDRLASGPRKALAGSNWTRSRGAAVLRRRALRPRRSWC